MSNLQLDDVLFSVSIPNRGNTRKTLKTWKTKSTSCRLKLQNMKPIKELQRMSARWGTCVPPHQLGNSSELTQVCAEICFVKSVWLLILIFKTSSFLFLFFQVQIQSRLWKEKSYCRLQCAPCYREPIAEAIKSCRRYSEWCEYYQSAFSVMYQEPNPSFLHKASPLDHVVFLVL